MFFFIIFCLIFGGAGRRRPNCLHLTSSRIRLYVGREKVIMVVAAPGNKTEIGIKTAQKRPYFSTLYEKA